MSAIRSGLDSRDGLYIARTSYGLATPIDQNSKGLYKLAQGFKTIFEEPKGGGHKRNHEVLSRSGDLEVCSGDRFHQSAANKIATGVT
jgi:hypothetical protein